MKALTFKTKFLLAQNSHVILEDHSNLHVTLGLVCYTAVSGVITQRGGALRDDTKNGCVADYSWVDPN